VVVRARGAGPLRAGPSRAIAVRARPRRGARRLPSAP
jgi:hypothetical protein